MKLRTLFLVLYLLSAFNVLAAAQVEERELQRSALGSAQQKADFTRKQANEAEQRAGAAERELAEAERADKEARQRASEAAIRLEEARAALSQAQDSQLLPAFLQNAQRKR